MEYIDFENLQAWTDNIHLVVVMTEMYKRSGEEGMDMQFQFEDST